MDMEGVNKPFLIFAAVLFTAIISGTIVTERILKVQEAGINKKPVRVVATETPKTPSPTPSFSVSPTSETPTVPIKKPSINLNEFEDGDKDQEDD
jgi:hypothetical protein